MTTDIETQFMFGDSEPINGKTYIADGWVYRDPNTRFTPEMWELFKNTLGKEGEDYIILAMSEIIDNKDNSRWFRGQFLISPNGLENAKRAK